MNFLAHIYLSGNNDEIKLGNFIGDYVKGNGYSKYPPMVKKGILLHRKIDFFTDSHTIVKHHKSMFYSKYHKYAGIITDIIYDHFLADNWHIFSETDLNEYIENIHEFLNNNIESMPLDLRKYVSKLIENKWLSSYKTIEGIENILIGMSKGTSLPAEYDFAILVLKKNYIEINRDFLEYFPQLINFVNKELEK